MNAVSRFSWFSLLAMVLVLAWAGCAPDSGEAVEEGVVAAGEMEAGPQEAEGCTEIRQARSVRFGNSFVELRPAIGRYKGDILVLHPWGETRDACCRNSAFCNNALSKGYRLILPDMGKSIYATHSYPETRDDWRKYPDYHWLRDSLIPGLQDQYCMLLEKGNNFVIGFSTGARGAIRLAADFPDLFVAAAGMSGDYNPGDMEGDNIYRGFLGEYGEYPERWTEVENLHLLAEDLQIPLYLGHGQEDGLVSYLQTQSLYNAVHARHPNLHVKLSLNPEAGDGFAYWNTEVNPVLRFFEDTQANRPETP